MQCNSFVPPKRGNAYYGECYLALFIAIPIIISNFGMLNCILCAMTAYSPTPKSLEKVTVGRGQT